MRYRFHLLILLLAATVSLPSSGDAAVVFRPGEKAKYVGPGEEEISGNAQELFEAAQQAEIRGDNGRAAKIYRSLVRKHPKDALAS
ncbi:MAG: hypothetical protein M3Y03_03715, partial [Verrucomicrobiota bacterium]|nr:hypothetical protein [Verrucomicrobiota bacterium]